jgi:hypothetical protein
MQRTNLYNWKFSISDILEIILVIIFNPHLKRAQILYDLVTEKNWLLFSNLVEAEAVSVVA